MSEYTPGPWRVGRNPSEVIADSVAPGIVGSDDVDHYGGHLIAESVSAANVRLIAAAPDLLAAVQAALDWQLDQSDTNIDAYIAKLRAAVAKATGTA